MTVRTTGMRSPTAPSARRIPRKHDSPNERYRPESGSNTPMAGGWAIASGAAGRSEAASPCVDWAAIPAGASHARKARSIWARGGTPPSHPESASLSTRERGQGSAEHLANAIEETLVDGRDLFAAVASVFLQQLALPSGKLARHVDVDAYQLVTPSVALKIRDPLAPQAKHRTGLGAGRNLQLGFLFERRNFELRAD